MVSDDDKEKFVAYMGEYSLTFGAGLIILSLSSSKPTNPVFWTFVLMGFFLINWSFSLRFNGLEKIDIEKLEKKAKWVHLIVFLLFLIMSIILLFSKNVVGSVGLVIMALVYGFFNFSSIKKSIFWSFEKIEGNKKQVFGVLGFFITIFVTGLIANQVVQPIFSPRISSVEYEPLYIQGTDGSVGGNEPIYYTYGKLTYNVDVPLFPGEKNNKIELKLPDDLNYNGKVQFAEIREINPYVKYPEWYFSPPYGDKTSLTIEIKQTGFSISELPISLHVRERIEDSRSQPSLGLISRYLHGDTITQPITQVPIARYKEDATVAFVRDKRSDKIFAVKQLFLKNIENLEVRGHKERVSKPQKVNHRILFCEEEVEFSERGTFERSVFLQMEFEPKEEKTITIVYDVSEPLESYQILEVPSISCLHMYNILKDNNLA